MTQASPPLPLSQQATDEAELLACLRTIGKVLIASGTSVGVVENTLIQIAHSYDTFCEVVALPNVILIKLGQSELKLMDFTVQQLTTLKLDQMSELLELIDRIKLKKITLGNAIQQVDRILAKPDRFNEIVVLLGFVLTSVGLTMRFRPEPLSLEVTGITGLLVGIMILWFKKRPRFSLLLPIIAATLVSALTFLLTKQGVIYGTANLIIPPLVTFLPGAALTTGMVELASMQVISGSSRLIYGSTSLLLLFVGIAVGFSLTRLPESMVYTYELVSTPLWASILGTLLFALGTFIRVSGANRDLFWFLVPGATGLLSVTSILAADIQSVVLGLGEMVFLIIAIAVGVLLGTLVVSPQKFTLLSHEARMAT